MNHRNGFNPLSRTTAHRRAMSRNMVTSLFRYERITTTKSKALEVRKSAEKLITRAKEDTVHNRREAAKFIQDEKILNKLFTEIGPRMKERNGGYTRVLKLGYRQGDAADIAFIELVDFDENMLKTPKAEKKTRRSRKAAAPKAKKAAAPKDSAAESKPKKSSSKKAASEKKEEASAE